MAAQCVTKVELTVSCDNLLDRDIGSKSDPLCVLQMNTSDSQWYEVSPRWNVYSRNYRGGKRRSTNTLLLFLSRPFPPPGICNIPVFKYHTTLFICFTCTPYMSFLYSLFLYLYFCPTTMQFLNLVSIYLLNYILIHLYRFYFHLKYFLLTNTSSSCSKCCYLNCAVV